ncbi:hypothetical protein [Dongia sp.]|uniref:hypothetical protein n=1 Tax=Dongia sp. TaxID=1977262 RepID=UPI0035B41560
MRSPTSHLTMITFAILGLGAGAGAALAAKDLPVTDKEFSDICNRTSGCMPVGDMGGDVNGYLYDDWIILCDDGGCTAYPPERTGTGKNRNSAVTGLLSAPDTMTPGIPLSPKQALKLKSVKSGNVLAN